MKAVLNYCFRPTIYRLYAFNLCIQPRLYDRLTMVK